ncbi:MAG: hypothetical protein ABL957_05305 [Parvularculaceae bacterium]
MTSGAREHGAAEKRRRAPPASAAIGIAASLAVIAMFAVHPLGIAGDYPNHLARTYIEAEIGASASLATYYEVAYGLIPDLTMDLVVPRLSQLIGVYAAGAVLLCLAALLAPWAGVAVSRRLHGAGSASLSALGFLAIFNLNLEFGFVNFLVSAGLALLAFALWIAAAPGWRRSLLIAPVSLFLVFNHALGFLLFGYLALLWEIGAFLRKERGPFAAFSLDLLTRDAVAFAPGVAVLLLALAGGGDSALRVVDTPTDYLASRLVVLFSPFRFHSDAQSVLTAVAAAAAVYGGVACALWRGVIDIDARMKPVLAGVLALVVLLPEHLFGIWGLHFRYGAIFVVLLGASLRFRGPAPGARVATAALVVGVLALQLHNGWSKIAHTDDYLGEVRAGLASMPEGARVLQSFDPSAPLRRGTHAGALAVIEKDAYVPSLFTNTSPVGVAPEMRALHLPAGYRLSLGTLAAAADSPLPPAVNGVWSEAYYFDWPRRFTHVLHMKAPDGSAPDLAGACFEAGGRFYALFRTGPCAPAAAPRTP